MWLNPPYGNGDVQPFARRLAAYWLAAGPAVAIISGNALTDAMGESTTGSRRASGHTG